MMGQLETVLATSSPDLAQVSQLKRSLEEKVDTLKLLDAEILNYIDEDSAIAEEIEQSDEFKGAVYAAIVRAEKDLPGVPTGGVVGPSGAATPAKANRVKLPKLELHSFTGDVTQWITFWDSYKSAIHDNDQLVAVDKFNYLKSLLTGTALEAIAGLTLSASNYEEAITILERRFGNRQQIIDKHMDQLLSVNPVASDSNLSGLRHLYDYVETHIRSLKSLEVTADSYGDLLSSVLLKKLPADVRLLISRKIPEEDWSLDALLKELHEELRARERVAIEKPPVAVGKGGSNGRHTASTLVSGATPGVPFCCYCRQAHQPKECKVVTQADQPST